VGWGDGVMWVLFGVDDKEQTVNLTSKKRLSIK